MASFTAVLVYIVLPAVVALATLEGLIVSFVLKRDYPWGEYFASLGDMVVRQYFIYAYVQVSIAAPLVVWAWNHRIATMPLNTVEGFATLFIGQEFCYYWYHRFSHQCRWFWATHAVHHSPNHLNFGAAYRLGWTGRMSGTMFFFVPLVWLGFAPGPVFLTLSTNLLYQVWVHTDWIPKLGWLEQVLNTPSHHRVHHAANPEYINANYGGALIIFDRLFGTLIVERDDLPCRYGLVKPLRSNNPVIIAFHEWAAIARDLHQARSWYERFSYLFGRPGWRPPDILEGPAAAKAPAMTP